MKELEITALEYWETRYLTGGNSGVGSYDVSAIHKADVINKYIEKYQIKTLADFGCGDGNQVMLLKGFLRYDGFDISKYAIELCRKNFADNKKMIFCTDITELPPAELCLSLDVLYHIIDDTEFAKYLSVLFAKSTKYVLIFSTNMVGVLDEHILHRRFTEYVEKQYPEFELIDVLRNMSTTSANFYLYERKTKYE